MNKILNMVLGLNLLTATFALSGIAISYPHYIELTNVLWGVVGQAGLNSVIIACIWEAIND